MLISLILKIGEFILNFILGLFIGLFPSLEPLVENINILIGYMVSGLSIVYFFVPQQIVVTCLDISIVAYGAKYAYKTGMWVVSKIPMLGIRD